MRLLDGISTELDKPGGPELPASWISGFYASGKSSFAKLLGLALDGIALPKIDPIAVVFDIGGVAREALAARTLKRPWSEARRSAMADDDFSQVIAKQFPDRYADLLLQITSAIRTRSSRSQGDDAFEADHADEVEALVTREHLRRQRKLAKAGETTSEDEPQGELDGDDMDAEDVRS